ncbi:cyclic lactone autoinducer peptide [Anaerobacterium chartisolvens]|nr:cyclic lactone autoinducer peptide [Anaerobacterium chartisolvens]
MKRKILTAIAMFVTLCAAAITSSASMIIWYQPKQPKCLSK